MHTQICSIIRASMRASVAGEERRRCVVVWVELVRLLVGCLLLSVTRSGEGGPVAGPEKGAE